MWITAHVLEVSFFIFAIPMTVVVLVIAVRESKIVKCLECGHDEMDHFLTSHETLAYECQGGRCRCHDLITQWMLDEVPS